MHAHIDGLLAYLMTNGTFSHTHTHRRIDTHTYYIIVFRTCRYPFYINEVILWETTMYTYLHLK